MSSGGDTCSGGDTSSDGEERLTIGGGDTSTEEDPLEMWLLKTRPQSSDSHSGSM